MKKIYSLLIGLFIVLSGLGFVLPILAKVFRYGFMPRLDVAFYTLGVVLVLAGGRMLISRARRSGALGQDRPPNLERGAA